MSRGLIELMKPVCYVALSRDWLSCFRFSWTHKTYLGNYYRELFCSFLCTGNVPEVLLWKDRNPIGGNYNCSSDMSRIDMTAVSLNCLKFSLTSVKTRLVVMNIIKYFPLRLWRSQEISFNSKIHLKPVSVQWKQNSQRNKKDY